MVAYLLDTNVISEFAKSRPNELAVSWVEGAGDTYISALTLGELERGAWLLRERDEIRSTRLMRWVEGLRDSYSEKILPVDNKVAHHWARRSSSRRLPAIDSLLAATALAHDLTIATRNEKDFVGTGAPTINPFSGGQA